MLRQWYLQTSRNESKLLVSLRSEPAMVFLEGSGSRAVEIGRLGAGRAWRQEKRPEEKTRRKWD